MVGLQEERKLIGAQPLNATGKVLRESGKVISEGPFMKGKELVGGYVACIANSYMQSIEISKGCSILGLENEMCR